MTIIRAAVAGSELTGRTCGSSCSTTSLNSSSSSALNKLFTASPIFVARTRFRTRCESSRNTFSVRDTNSSRYLRSVPATSGRLLKISPIVSSDRAFKMSWTVGKCLYTVTRAKPTSFAIDWTVRSKTEPERSTRRLSSRMRDLAACRASAPLRVRPSTAASVTLTLVISKYYQ